MEVGQGTDVPPCAGMFPPVLGELGIIAGLEECKLQITLKAVNFIHLIQYDYLIIIINSLF